MEFSDLIRQFDPREDVRGRQFERLCRWYLLNAPEYRRRFKEVWLWKDWPEAWAADAGIDLVAEERDGSLWAVQAKAYDEAYSIKKKDVDSFLSESNRPQISYRLLVATTDRIGATARRTLEDQTVPVGYLLRSQLDLAPVDWPESLDSLRPRRPQPKKPFPHVQEAIKETVKGFTGTQRGQLIMACGTGKTLVGLWSSERLKSVRTLVLVPSLSLLAQTLREWSANATQPFDYLAVCSDETVVGEDEFVASTAELGIPVTTDPGEISSFLRRRGRRVVFATYQSSPQIAAAQKRQTPRFDLAIADEAHRCAGRVAGEFATILDANRIKSRRRLFMTATPRYYTPRLRREAGQLDVEVASMDDEAAFGRVFHELTFGEAITRQLLSDYQVIVVGVDDDTYAVWAEKGEFVTVDGKNTTDARTLAGQIGLAKAMRKYDLRRIISFHGRIKAAREFSSDMPDVIAWMPSSQRPGGQLWSKHVSSLMTSGQRDRLLRRFANVEHNERNLLSNARCLAEGVDVPSIDAVAFIDPKHSTIDIIQAVGRAIRRAENKKVGTVVVPVFIPKRADAEQALEDSTFSHVWDVLKALRAHDETLGEELDELRRRLGARQSPPRRPRKIKLDVPAGRVGIPFIRAFNARLVEQTTSSWEFWFGLLQRFVAREGHGRVPSDHRESGYRLGEWVGRERSRARVSDEHARRLEALPGWAWHADEAKWEDGYTRVLQYIERFGDSRVPPGYRDDTGFAVGQWVGMQRGSRKSGALSDERVRRLEALPGWSWNVLEGRWEDRYLRLVRFCEREGHSRVPSSYRDDDGYPLGSWVTDQRSRGQRLSEERRQRLEALPGWMWNSRGAAWEDRYLRLTAFAEREGHCRVPTGYRDDDGIRLDTWVQVQRRSWDAGDLPLEQAERLEALPGWTWQPQEAAWDEGYARLRRYVEREGHAQVPSKYRDEDEYALGSWVINQRAFRRRGQLSDQRARHLEALPGWVWHTREANWELGFANLLRFVERVGHTAVPDDFMQDGFRLGAWVRKQRRYFAQGKLAPERVRLLGALPGWVWNAFQSGWEEGFARLSAYVDREGHARVPQGWREDDYPLGRWVYGQRQSIKKGRLDPTRRARLEALSGWVLDPYEADWEAGFARLQAFVRREGSARVPDAYEDDVFRLGQWARVQRRAFAVGRLDSGRASRLAALAGWTWDPHEASWEEGFARLSQYVEREGHARVPSDYKKDGFRLGAWVSAQRGRFTKGSLDAEWGRRLAALPGWSWDARESKWEEGFAVLSKYAKREEHTVVPVDYKEDGFPLGGWVRRQRVTFREGSLQPERMERLVSLPEWKWDTRYGRSVADVAK